MEDTHANPFATRLTDDLHALAWSPQPPYTAAGAHDCRIGGDCGLDPSRESPRARWVQARYRWRKQCYDHLPLRTL